MNTPAVHLARQALQLLATAHPGMAYYFLISLSAYRAAHRPPATELSPRGSLALDMPRIFPRHHQASVGTQPWPQQAPAVWCLELAEADVMGKSDFVFIDFLCLHPDHLDFARDRTAEEANDMVQITAADGLLARRRAVVAPLPPVPAAISLLGSATQNYAHWLTETAPKLALLDAREDYADLPLLVDADLHANLLQSIACLSRRPRRLIAVQRGQLCRVGRLVTITATACVPYEFRPQPAGTVRRIEPDLATFVPAALHALRQQLAAVVPAAPVPTPRRIYLQRNASVRRMRNAAAVESLLREQGFETVAPEDLSFIEQVQLMRKASLVVAPAGAGLGNLLFAPPGCAVVILSAWSPASIYYYFSNMAAIQGLRCSYVLGTSADGGPGQGVHQDFSIDLEDLHAALTATALVGAPVLSDDAGAKRLVRA